MNATLRKIGALLAKDFADLAKNPVTVISLLMPVAFVAGFSLLYGDPATYVDVAPEDVAAAQQVILKQMLVLALCFTVGMVGTMVVLNGIAEEKEKNTLRTLMLANVSASQIMISRTVVCLVSVAVVETACFLVLKADVALLPAFIALGLLGSVPIILFSLVAGLASRDQMTASVFSVPVLLLALAPMYAVMNEHVGTVVRYAPTGGVVDLMNLAFDGNFAGTDALAPALVTVAWIVVGIAVFVLLYKRLARDN